MDEEELPMQEARTLSYDGIKLIIGFTKQDSLMPTERR
jgi:hypothetical protein